MNRKGFTGRDFQTAEDTKKAPGSSLKPDSWLDNWRRQLRLPRIIYENEKSIDEKSPKPNGKLRRKTKRFVDGSQFLLPGSLP